eukprot:CAMPEP_0118642578 /NCGR_PEP_ID=MMETSP0785-20121206/5907_1 /TAXON_ID=91992 /ORGANISM="Bolidomonas pacifica, Strain CCMP 1866" /LENGTH=458 /DNA_ID=CAMNT_0006534133 /DNA_START=23 /DNA_END=1396 /DNA_ORIENTATION=+
MPRVPQFTLSQTSTSLSITIRLPFIRVSSSETLVEGCNVSFSCSPYLLKLTFPGELVEDDDSTAVYDPNDENGTLTLTLSKVVEGDFPDLDLTTKLLQPRALPKKLAARNASGPPLIEVVGTTTNEDAGEDSDDEDEGDEEVTVADCGKVTDGVDLKVAAPHYGFNQSFSNSFSNLREQLQDMCECKGMDELTTKQKRELREGVEEEKFDSDRYCGDYFANSDKFLEWNEEGKDPLYVCACDFAPWWAAQPSPPPPPSVEDLTETLQGLTFDEKEQEALANLPNKEHLISHHRPVQLGLIDILFGYAYDCRMTEGESNVESPWTISILSPTLSWFESWDPSLDSPREVMVAAARRSLIYPYCRFLGLSTLVLEDVLQILQMGRRAVLKSLLACRSIMERSDTHYMLNKFYLDDYSIWVQKIEEGLLGEFTLEVEGCLKVLSKEGWKELKQALDLDLVE